MSYEGYEIPKIRYFYKSKGSIVFRRYLIFYSLFENKKQFNYLNLIKTGVLK